MRAEVADTACRARSDPDQPGVFPKLATDLARQGIGTEALRSVLIVTPAKPPGRRCRGEHFIAAIVQQRLVARAGHDPFDFGIQRIIAVDPGEVAQMRRGTGPKCLIRSKVGARDIELAARLVKPGHLAIVLQFRSGISGLGLLVTAEDPAKKTE